MVVVAHVYPPHTKRERTRNRLLAAAQLLLREQGAGSLGIRDISHRAGVSHPTFYNYFASVEDLLDNLALLFAVTHGAHLATVTAGRHDPGEIFSISTRQTLRFVAQSADYGHYLFDAGLRIDRLINGMREGLRHDLERGAAEGIFAIADMELTLAQITGSLLGISLALHRRELPASRIEAATAQLLRTLGVPADRAEALSTVEVAFVAPPSPPLQWPIAELASE